MGRIFDHRLIMIAFCLPLGLCKSSEKQETTYSRATRVQLKEMNWAERAAYLENAPPPNTDETQKIYRLLLNDENDEVVIQALARLTHFRSTEYKNYGIDLLTSKNRIIRWKALKYITALPIVYRDLIIITELFKDKEWLVRELAFQSIRNYSEELTKKKYIYKILLSINEGNSQVLKEIYKTLRWYNDQRSFPFVFKRSYYTYSHIELIYIMRELKHYKSAKVRNRIRYIAKKHSSSMVKSVAQDILAEL